MSLTPRWNSNRKKVQRLKKPFKSRNQYDGDTWRIFRIMSELVDGFEMMSEIGPAVTIFGSARTPPKHPYYHKAREIAFKLAQKGYSIITGGGSGMMEAANRGAQEAGGCSVGLNIDLPMEQVVNSYVNVPVGFRYFFVRKVMFIKYALAVIIMPGGMGTMDECFEVVTLIQTQKIRKIPVILVGREYWKELLDWMKKRMVKQGMLDQAELAIFKIMDDTDAIVKEIGKKSRTRLPGKENF